MKQITLYKKVERRKGDVAGGVSKARAKPKHARVDGRNRIRSSRDFAGGCLSIPGDERNPSEGADKPWYWTRHVETRKHAIIPTLPFIPTRLYSSFCHKKEVSWLKYNLSSLGKIVAKLWQNSLLQNGPVRRILLTDGVTTSIHCYQLNANLS